MAISVAILGATGYTGAELIRLLDAHPEFEIEHLAAHSQAGKRVSDVLPGIASISADKTLATSDAAIPDSVQLVFTALPHAAAAQSVKAALDAGKRVVDLSADFRHANLQNYEQAYGLKHPFPAEQEQAVYGLTEHARSQVAATNLVANPGCYPTSVLLPLIPLLQSTLVQAKSIVIDSKSGTSGAGRSPKTELLYCEINESLAAYGLPKHRHAWEMEEWATSYGAIDVSVRFVPHIIPMTRGMLSTIHLSGEKTSLWHEILSKAYANEPFVNVLPVGKVPNTGAVKGSNRCDIGIMPLNDTEAVVVSCIDNLLKGASGQAIQNANVMFGFAETTGLSVNASWP
ncbi:MAG: N-acetyl-gamma-glutamyl-phosphate reductase [Zetaproteobacteria bacterium CG2_30_46_52]|nr:MAG: N-acetyl-gamma-glutamyl-phosphate reductase [Zetaproteobacteria bacterium CG2_30_46_52]